MIKIISCNIEGDRHLNERLLPFFKAEQPDVLCLQEVFEDDLYLLQQATGLQNCVFCPEAIVNQKNIHLPVRGSWGIAILAREIIKQQADYYVGSEQTVPEFFVNQNPNSMNRMLLSAQVRFKQQLFQVMTTHFTWSGQGAVTEEQRKDYAVLKNNLNKFQEVIFCGDLNTPRGGDIFDDLAKKYTDNIPLNIDTTIDKNLHKSGKDLHLVVDAFFTSAHYLAHHVRVVPNTSDHMAVVGEIERVLV
jgi:exonuclease III